MNPPSKFSKVIGGKRYDVETATLLAGNDYWNGNNFERGGTNTFLYKTPRGSYFTVYLTQWENDYNELTPITINQAIELFENMREQRVDYAIAFPSMIVEFA